LMFCRSSPWSSPASPRRVVQNKYDAAVKVS
jgi:hypothetical protein